MELFENPLDVNGIGHEVGEILRLQIIRRYTLPQYMTLRMFWLKY